MATSRRQEVEGVGTVVLMKHRRAKNLKLTMLPSGEARVTLPSWLPFQAGLRFAIKNQAWIEKHRPPTQLLLESGMQIGKSGRLRFVVGPREHIKSRVVGNEIRVIHPADAAQSEVVVQQTARKGIERYLRLEAELLLPHRLAQLAEQVAVQYHSVSIKKLRARWGSCNAKKDIVLNLYLMQLPWHLIDYVLLHELTHAVHLHHGTDFWDYLNTICPDSTQRRKQLKQFKPSL
jgi:predicted metal-dependent hydrolase